MCTGSGREAGAVERADRSTIAPRCSRTCRGTGPATVREQPADRPTHDHRGPCAPPLSRPRTTPASRWLRCDPSTPVLGGVRFPGGAPGLQHRREARCASGGFDSRPPPPGRFNDVDRGFCRSLEPGCREATRELRPPFVPGVGNDANPCRGRQPATISWSRQRRSRDRSEGGRATRRGDQRAGVVEVLQVASDSLCMGRAGRTARLASPWPLPVRAGQLTGACDLLGQFGELLVVLLREPLQDLDGHVGRQAVAGHHDPLGLPDHIA